MSYGSTFGTLSTSAIGAGLSTTLDTLQPGVLHTFTFTPMKLSGNYTAAITDGGRQIAAITMTAMQTYNLSFTPSGTSVALTISANTATASSIQFTGWTWYSYVNEPEPVVVTICGSDVYRYGMNGQAKDNQWAGLGNHYEFKSRLYDPRVSRFISIDPIAKQYPWNSPYNFAEDRVIDGKDMEGLEYVGFGLGVMYANSGKTQTQIGNELTVTFGTTAMIGAALGIGVYDPAVLPYVAGRAGPMLSAGLVGAGVNGAISALESKSSYETTKSIFTGFASGAALGLNGSSTLTSILTTGSFSGAIGEYTNQLIDNVSGNGNGYDYKKMAVSSGVGAVANLISNKLVEQVEGYIDKQVSNEISNTNTSEFKNGVRKALQEADPSLNGKRLDKTVNSTISGIQQTIKSQGNKLKAGAQQLIERSTDVIQDKVNDKLKEGTDN